MAAPVYESVTHTLLDGASQTFDMPGTRPDDDLYVLELTSDSDGLAQDWVSNGELSGWTTISATEDSPSANTGSLVLAWRIGSSEPATYTLTGQTNDGGMASVVRISGVDTTTPINADASDAAKTATAIAPAVTPDVADTLILRTWYHDDTTFTTVPSTTRWNLLGDGSNSQAGSTEAGPAADTSSGTASATCPSDEWIAATIAVAPVAATSQTISVGQATETDTANAVTVTNPRTYTLGQATETDTASAVTVDNPRSYGVGQATETDVANAVTVAQSSIYVVGQATETDAASALTVINPRTYTLGQASETDTANAVTLLQPQVITVGAATESDSANAVTISRGTVSVGQAVEVDIARALTVVNPRTYTLGRATETDVARTLRTASSYTVASDARTYVVPDGERTYAVPEESWDATFTVPSEARRYLVREDC